MADRVLVAYGSKYGSTAEIAEAIGKALRSAGLQADVAPARDVRSIDPYRAIVPGSAVYMGRWPPRPKNVQRLATEIGAHDHVVFGGRVSEDAGGFMRKSMARKTPPELRDRRDWSAIDAWAKGVASAVTG